MIFPYEYAANIQSTAEEQGFASKELARTEGFPIVALHRPAGEAHSSSGHLYLSSGVHGDEPAGPMALLRLIKENHLPRHLDITVLPLINPTGFALKTRENSAGNDLNRDFRYPQNPETNAVKKYIDTLPDIDLSIALHEDWESSGFYMYAVSPQPAEPKFRKIIDEVSRVGPIETASEIDESPANRGLISPPIEDSMAQRQDWPEAFLLYSKNQHPHLTTETPSSLAIETRIEMQIVALRTAIQMLTDQKSGQSS